MGRYVTLYCIWPKCDEHCHPSSDVCSRHYKRVRIKTAQLQQHDEAGNVNESALKAGTNSD